jgi:serine/threonine protein kinase
VKTCPLCSTSYPGHHTNCEHDGALLIASHDFDPGTVIRGKYRIERLLGRGGMGSVYLAEHLLLGRLRALKFISSELSQDPALLKRFRREALAASELHHPNVVQVLDLDQAEDGAPFIAMEYIEGEDLCHLIAHGPLPVERALELTRGITLGLGAAHSKRILHRDVKPANILIACEPGQPKIPKLLDFGIAAVKEDVTAVSHTRGLLLTPEYAAPEQWRGMPAEQQDGRVDLYALGGVLYQMLTGRTCFLAQNLEGWMYNHLSTEPQPPSFLRPELNAWPGLDALVLRLLAKDRDQRPRNTAEVIASLDVINFVEIKPHAVKPEAAKTVIAEAHPPALVAEPTAAAHPPTRIAESAAATPAPTIIDGSAFEHLTPAITDKSPNAAIEPPLLVIEPAPRRSSAPFWLAAILLLLALSTAAWLYLHAHHPFSSPVNTTQNVSPSLRTIPGVSSVTSVAFSPNGHTLASGCADKTISLWSAANGKLLHTFHGHSDNVNSVAFSPDGRILASGSWDRTIKLWDAASGKLLRTIQGHSENVNSVAFSPDGRFLVSGSDDKTVKLWNVASGQLVRTFHGHTDSVETVAFSSDGRTLASGSWYNTIKLWDAASGELLRTLPGHAGYVYSVAFSPDGRTLASGSQDKTIKLWNVASGQLLRTLQGHSDSVQSVAFNPNGRILASGSDDKTIKLWDVASGQLLRTLQDSDNVYSVAYSPDGRTLASGCWRGNIKLWDVSSLLK